MKSSLSPLRIALWLLVFVGALPAAIYLGEVILAGIRGDAVAQPVYFQSYYGAFFILVFVCIAWLAQQLNLWWGVVVGLPALFVGIYPALENFGSEKLVSGAVVAFDRGTCPPGWESYNNGRGRVLVGAGQGTADEQGRPLSLRKINQTGGEEMHVLTIPEMPKHDHSSGNHKLLLEQTGRNTAPGFDDTSNEIDMRFGKPITSQGEGKPHNTMPPFIVLTFCIKL